MPTCSPETKQDYRERTRRIAETENKNAGRRLSPVELVKAVMKRDLQPSSIRQVRAAMTFTMTEAAKLQPANAASLNAAIGLLGNWVSQKDTEGEPRTSQCKQKVGVEADLSRICHAVLATASEYAKPLVAALNSGALTGARFVEWPTAEFGASTVPGYGWELIVVNGKNSNGRAHGETRTLRWESLPDHLVTQMTFWIAVAKAANERGRYDTLGDTLKSLMRRVTKELFPRRLVHPTLSSVRHAATARFKRTYVATATTEEQKLHGLAMVAALLGHASDATATKHYARAEDGKGHFPVPMPDPAEVARIRRRFAAPKHRDDPGLDAGASDHQE